MRFDRSKKQVQDDEKEESLYPIINLFWEFSALPINQTIRLLLSRAVSFK